MSKLERDEVCFMFHTLGGETVKQAPINWNNMRNKDETSSLKALASKALERLRRNKERNKYETERQKAVSRPHSDETNYGDQEEPSLHQYPWIQEEYEERIAIAQYDGQQTPTRTQLIAYQDAFISVLNDIPFDESPGNNSLEKRISKAIAILLSNNIKPTLPEK